MPGAATRSSPGTGPRNSGCPPSSRPSTWPSRTPGRCRPSGHAPCITFQRGGLGSLRAFVTAEAQQAGLDQRPASALVAAINELATNSLQHGGGQGELRIWTDDGWLLCEVSDQGHLTEPLAVPPPAPDAGAGLWLANQLTDLLQIHSSPPAPSSACTRSCPPERSMPCWLAT